MEPRKYKLRDGTIVPLFEADYDTSFKVYKADRKRAVVGDPYRCIEAIGLCRLPNVQEAHIGAGKDAIVTYSKTMSRPFPHAVHFTIPANSVKVRDTFESNKDIKSQILMLRAPTQGRTLAHRSTLNKARRQAIRKGAAIRRRTRPTVTRKIRFGFTRPRAKISRDGVIYLKPDND